jgi:hypothetical protein
LFNGSYEKGLTASLVLWYYGLDMTPDAAFRRLNRLLWLNRLPKPVITLVDDSAMPSCFGLTINNDRDFTAPLVFLNTCQNWGKTLVHECLHIAEPELAHGKLFEALVECYWRKARKEIRGLK